MNINETKVISGTGNFQINKLKDLNKLLKDKCNKLKTENQQLKQKQSQLTSNSNSNENPELENQIILLRIEKDNLESKDKENTEKINNLNVTIDNISKEIRELRLKLLKAGSDNGDGDGDKDIDQLKNKINEQKTKIESLIKQNIDVNKVKITETTKLSLEISKLKAEIISLTNKSNDNSNSNYANKNEAITDNEEFNELKNKNKQLEEKNIILWAQLEKNKNAGDDGEGKDDNNIELQNLKQKYNTLVTKLKEAQENIKKATLCLERLINIMFVSLWCHNFWKKWNLVEIKRPIYIIN